MPAGLRDTHDGSLDGVRQKGRAMPRHRMTDPRHPRLLLDGSRPGCHISDSEHAGEEAASWTLEAFEPKLRAAQMSRPVSVHPGAVADAVEARSLAKGSCVRGDDEE